MKRIPIISLMISFVLISTTMMIWQKGAGSSYPGTGDWTITSNQAYVIDQNCEIVGNIYNYGNLTFKDCTVYINNSLYTLYCYDGSNLNFSNVIVRGRDSAGGTNFGGLQIIFHGSNFAVVNSQFRTMPLIPITSYRSCSIKNTIFDTLSGGIRARTAEGNEITGNITDCTFQNIPTDWAISIEGESSYLAYSWNISKNQIYSSKGFNFEWTHNSTIASNYFSNPVLRAIEMAYYSTNNTITDNTFMNPQIGIEVWNAFETTIKLNTFSNVKSSGIFLYGAQNTVISNATMSIYSGDGVTDLNSGNYHNYVNDSKFTLISNTQVKQALNLGQDFSATKYLHVDNDTTINDVAIVNFENLQYVNMDLFNVKYSKVLMTNCYLVTLSNVIVENADGFFFGNNQNCTISNINASSNYHQGIRLDRCTNNTLQYFTSVNNRKEGLISNLPPSAPFISNNNYLYGNCSGNAEEGAELKAESFIHVQNVTFSNNLYGGILTYEISNGTFVNCSFRNNVLEGVFVDHSNNNTFNGNVFSYNGATNLYFEGYSESNYATQNEFIQPLNERFNVQNYQSTNKVYRNHYSNYFGFDDNPQDGYGDISYWTNGSMPLEDISPIVDDADKDKLDRLLEAYYGTDPLNNDTDSDLLSDFQELYPQIAFATLISQNKFTFWLQPTNPLKNDTDFDSISDFDELNGTFGYLMDPNSMDTDSDGFNDQTELAQGSNPIDASQWPGKPKNPLVEENSNKSTEPEPIRSVKSVPGYPSWIILLCSCVIVIKVVCSEKRKIRRVSYA